MKFACLLILALACAVAVAPAQTNTATNGVESILALVTTNHPPVAATNPPSAKPRYVHIQSAGPAILDFDNHWVTYSDNVLVSNDEMKLTCEWIKAEFSAHGDQATNIVAETNVVIDFTDPKGKQGRAIGTNALYVFQVQDGLTNETVTLTGDPPEIFEGQNYTNHTVASKVIYDLITRRVKLEAPNGVAFTPGTSNSPAGNNLPLPK